VAMALHTLSLTSRHSASWSSALANSISLIARIQVNFGVGFHINI
jgi:hypothetical protein